jgi:TP901 family phage tail tape measure protein
MAQPVQIQFWANANFTSLNSAIAATNKQLSLLNRNAIASNAAVASSFSNLNKDFARAVASTGMWTSQLVNIETQTNKFAKSLSMGKTGLKEYNRELRNYFRDRNSMVQKLAAQQVRMQQSILTPVSTTSSGRAQAQLLTPQVKLMDGTPEGKAFTKAIRAQEFAIMNKMLANASTNVINLGKNTQWAGRQLTMGLTFPLTAIAGLASKTFIDLERQLVRLAKVYGDTGGTSAGAIREIQDEVRVLARELGSLYGIKLEDTISLSADFAARGLTGKELTGAVRQTTRLQVLGDLDQDQAMKTTMALQTAFRLNTEKLTQAINFLNAVENQTALQLQDVTVALPKVAPIIRSFGGDVKELTLFLTAMREGAVPAGEAANALKTSIGRLLAPTKQAKTTLSELGIDLEELVAKNAGNLTQMFLDLQTELDALNRPDRTKALERIFGKMQSGRLTALVDNLGRPFSQTSEVIKLMEGDIAELAATANRELLAISNSAGVRLKGKIQELRDTFANFGEAAAPVFIELLKQILKFVSFLDRLPRSTKKIAGIGLAFTAALGPVVMFSGILMNFFGQLLRGLSFIATALGVIRKIKPFELITADSQAAALAQENLTKSSARLSEATAKISGLMKVYSEDLRRLIAQQQGFTTSIDRTTNAMVRQSQAVVGGTGANVGVAGTTAAVVAGSRRKGNAGQYRDPITGRFGKDPSTLPKKINPMSKAGGILASPKALGISTVGLLAGTVMSTSDNKTTSSIGQLVSAASVLMFLPSILAAIGVSAGAILPVTIAIVALASSMFVLFKRSGNAKQRIEDLGQSFSKSSGFLDSYGIVVNNVGQLLRNNLTDSVLGARQELERLNEVLTGDESYDAIKRLLERPSAWQQVLGKSELPEELLVPLLQSEYNLMVSLGMPPGEAGNIIQAALLSQGREELSLKLNFESNLSRDKALQGLIDIAQGDLRNKINVTDFLQGMDPVSKKGKEDVLAYTSAIEKAKVALNDYMSDFVNNLKDGSQTVGEITEKLDALSVDQITMDAFNESIFNSNKQLFETDNTLRSLIENTNNLADKMLITYLNSEKVSSAIIATAAAFGQIRELGAAVAGLSKESDAFARRFIKDADTSTKANKNSKEAIDAKIKALQKEIDALKEIGRQEQNINRLKELQLKLDDRRKNLMADYINAFTSGDLDAALRSQIDLSSAQRDFKNEYGQAKDEIARENKIKQLEDEIKKLEELKDTQDKVGKRSKDNANEVAKNRDIISKVINELASANISKIGQVGYKITAEVLGQQLAKIIKDDPTLGEFSVLKQRYKISDQDIIDDVIRKATNIFKEATKGIAPPTTKAAAEKLDEATLEARKAQIQNMTVQAQKDVNITGTNINVNTKGSTPLPRPTTAAASTKGETQKDYQRSPLFGDVYYNRKTGKTIKQSEFEKLPKYATGGYVEGRGTGTSDSIPARLSAGEYVVKASSVKKYGKDTLDQLNFGSGGMIPGYPMGGLIPYKDGGMLDNPGMKDIISEFKAVEGKGSPKDLINAAMIFFPYGKLAKGIGKAFGKIRNLNKKPTILPEPLMPHGPILPAQMPGFSSIEEFIQRPLSAYGSRGGFYNSRIDKFLRNNNLNVSPGEKFRALSDFDVDQLSKLKVGDVWSPAVPKSFGQQADLQRLGAAVNATDRKDLIGSWRNSAMARIDVVSDSVPGISSTTKIGRETGIAGEGLFGPSVGYVIDAVPSPKGGSYILRAIDLAGNKMGGLIKGYGMGGPTNDSILARVSNGEYVMSAAAVKKLGVGFMDRVNSGSMNIPAFAGGGYVTYSNGAPTVPSYAVGGQIAPTILETIGSKYNAGNESSSDIVYNYNPTFNLNGTSMTEDQVKAIIIDTQKEFVRKVGRWNS